jgi:hypothetical protein
MISSITIPVVHCTLGVYLRWYFNGFHYFNFRNGFEISMSTESMGTQITNYFSIVSRVERSTKIKAEYSYHIILEGITLENIGGFAGLLMAERVDQYENNKWYEVEITRGDHLIKSENAPGYILDFEITRKELPNTAAVYNYQKSILLYIGDTLCDMDTDEVIPVNKQTKTGNRILLLSLRYVRPALCENYLNYPEIQGSILHFHIHRRPVVTCRTG